MSHRPIFNHSFVNKYPNGAIRHVRDLLYAIQALEGCSVYAVMQGGYIQESKFSEDAVVESDQGIRWIKCKEENPYADDGFFGGKVLSWGLWRCVGRFARATSHMPSNFPQSRFGRSLFQMDEERCHLQAKCGRLSQMV